MLARATARALGAASVAAPVRTVSFIRMSPRKNTVEDGLKLVDEHKLLIFSKSYCDFCAQTKMTFDEVLTNPDDAKVVELDNLGKLGTELSQALEAKYSHKTVPAIFMGSTFVGGHSKLKELIASGDLGKRLDELGIAHK